MKAKELADIFPDKFTLEHFSSWVADMPDRFAWIDGMASLYALDRERWHDEGWPALLDETKRICREQWDWLKELYPGTKVRSRGVIYMCYHTIEHPKPWPWVNLETGMSVHHSALACPAEPPVRVELAGATLRLTLDGYVLPRLASALVHAVEVVETEEIIR